jgi:hypothetical protein
VAPAPHIEVTLNSAGVLYPALRAIRQTVDVVTFCLNAIEQGDLSGWPQTDLMRFDLRFDDEVSAEQRKAAYAHWLLSKGFQDLARGIRQMLEEAYFYNGIVARAGQLRAWAELQAAQQELREAATNKNFPQLLEEINKELTSPLHYERELLSLQAVRNCLEHRDGIVQERDVDPATRVLHLRLPRLRLFYEDEGRQIELSRGSQVEKDTAIMMDVVLAKYEFKLGARVTFNAAEFHDIGFGCWRIANDLVHRLPQLPPKVSEPRSANDMGAS